MGSRLLVRRMALTPYKLSMAKHVYVPLRGDDVLVVSYSEVYSSKTGALVREDAIYGEYVVRDVCG